MSGRLAGSLLFLKVNLNYQILVYIQENLFCFSPAASQPATNEDE
jgi:hypothetical protein